ncbi:hypothetical protein APHAL10511_004662 [Amanita phalloides]|nr:hypothetical protein APHAL10511_004662 [Amanita phalloides]
MTFSRKTENSKLGAPSQFKQTSRKGKKAWRKNVDLDDVEEALEEMRAEEREIGTTLQKTQDTDLFQIDVTGDDQIRNAMPPRAKVQLTSLRILSQRSSVPAVFSRTTSEKRKASLTREEKDKLLRIAKRPRKGPLNSVLDPSEYKSGSSIVELSAAVKASGKYNIWQREEDVTLPDGLETVQKKNVKTPNLPHPRQAIHVPAVVEPHQGTSYNPSFDAYHILLRQAYEKEEKRVQEEEKLSKIREKTTKSDQIDEDDTVALGINLVEVADEQAKEGGEEEFALPPKKLPQRKTKQQRLKAAKHLAAQRALAEKMTRRKMQASVGVAKGLGRAMVKLMRVREEERAQRRLAVKDRIRRRGLTGLKLGKHIVPEGEVEVQLGEDLSETLRGVKPEGNLFRDRFLSMQQRALVEPRIRVIPKKRRSLLIQTITKAMEHESQDEIIHQLSSTLDKPLIVYVDESHPFDLEGYISNYTGRTAVDRLIHITYVCPTVAVEAYQLALQHIQPLRDPLFYSALTSAYDQVNVNSGRHLPLPFNIARIDGRWLDEVGAKNQAEKTKLEVELKTYTNNMIKESIRMAHRDLGNFYRATGDHTSAIKHFAKCREFCTTSQHILDVCLSVIELMIEQRNYSNLTTYIFKAEAALEATLAVNPNSGNATANAAAQNAKKRDKEHIQTKLDLATAFAHLGQGSYEKVAAYIFRLGPPKDLGDWVGKLITPADIAIYGALCALAGMSRGALKTQLEASKCFADYLEQEPYVRELLNAYMSSNFKTVLELLLRYSTRHYIDLHLSSHVQQLTNMIRNWAVVLYFQPFKSIRLDRMASAFGWTVEEVEQNVVVLIQSGQIEGRVDSQNKILQAKQTDFRAELFARAIKAGKDMQAANRKLLLRMRLQQADLIAKPPKQQHHYQAPQTHPSQWQFSSHGIAEYRPGD